MRYIVHIMLTTFCLFPVLSHALNRTITNNSTVAWKIVVKAQAM